MSPTRRSPKRRSPLRCASVQAGTLAGLFVLAIGAGSLAEARPGGGHSYSGGGYSGGGRSYSGGGYSGGGRSYSGGGYTTPTEAAELMWDFFRHHRLPKN